MTATKTPPTPKQLERAYTKQKHTLREIADEHGTSPTTVRRWLQDAGVPLRRRGPRSRA